MINESFFKEAIKTSFRYLLGASFALQVILLLDSYVATFTASDITTPALWASVLLGGIPFAWIIKPAFTTRAFLGCFLIGTFVVSLTAAMKANVVMILMFPAAFGLIGIVVYMLALALESAMNKIEVSSVVEPVVNRTAFKSQSSDNTAQEDSSDRPIERGGIRSANSDHIEQMEAVGHISNVHNPEAIATYWAYNDN